MRVLILQHEKSTPPGSTIDWCEKRGYPYQVLMVSEILDWPSTSDFDLLVICGGSMNVDQEATIPWLRREKIFIDLVIKDGKKIVGLCLGAQLLAEVLGGSVVQHPQWEVGWHSVKLKNGKELMVFQWHGYSFTLPPNAELIATNSNCTNQGFAVGNQVLAFQFHPETTREWAIECADDPQLPTTGFVQTREEIKRDLSYQPILQEWYFSQLDGLIGKS